MAYEATECAVLKWRMKLRSVRYGVCGTERAYAATECTELRWRMPYAGAMRQGRVRRLLRLRRPSGTHARVSRYARSTN
eukprot:1011210-Rhodomonas_salina.1